MSRSVLSLLFIYLILSSCALNKLFLVPYKLDTSSTITAYVKEFNDTISVSFSDNKTPLLYDSKNRVIEFPYNLESIFFQNSKGNQLNAWMFTPTTNYNGTTIYFLHGNAGNLVYQNSLVSPFVKAGFQVFEIDYSGFGFSAGKSTRKNVHLDATDGLRYLMGRNDINYEKLIIYGQSLGGHLATVVATENQDAIDGLIIEGAFSSHKDIAANMVPILGRIFTREMYSAKKSIPKLKKPVLIIHSTEDETIPYKQGVKLYKLATEPKVLYTIDKPHIRGPIYYSDSIVRRIKEMIK